MELAKKLFYEAWPLILAGVVNSVYIKVDQVMIGLIVGSREVGIYAAASRLSEIWFVVGVVVVKSIYPAIIRSKEISEGFYLKRLGDLFYYLVFFAYILIVITVFMSDKIVTFLYGELYAETSVVLAVHIVSVVFVYLGVASGRWIIIEGKAYLDLYRNLFAVFFNVISNIYMIKVYGAVGAAIASMLSYIISFYFFDLFFRDMRHIFYLKTRALILRRSSIEKL